MGSFPREVQGPGLCRRGSPGGRRKGRGEGARHCGMMMRSHLSSWGCLFQRDMETLGHRWRKRASRRTMGAHRSDMSGAVNSWSGFLIPVMDSEDTLMGLHPTRTTRREGGKLAMGTKRHVTAVSLQNDLRPEHIVRSAGCERSLCWVAC